MIITVIMSLQLAEKVGPARSLGNNWAPQEAWGTSGHSKKLGVKVVPAKKIRKQLGPARKLGNNRAPQETWGKMGPAINVG